MKYRWEHMTRKYAQETFSRTVRAHWYLNRVDPEGDTNSSRWTILRRKNAYYVLDMYWPELDWAECQPHIKAGPFDALVAAKVAFRLNVSLGTKGVFNE